MKLFLACSVLIAATVAEPPVNNRYLPPQQGLSQAYGAPGFAQRQTDAVFRPQVNRNFRPSAQYGPPQPSPQYGAPINQPSNQYLPANAQRSSQFGALNFAQHSRQNARNSPQPSRQYGLPNAVQPSSQYLPSLVQPSTQYGAPGQDQARPSQQYGAPGIGSFGDQYKPGLGSYRAAEQSREYLPPGSGYSGDGSNGEPANYNFEYMVKDDLSGNDFGHRESRQGDRAEGLYYVVLPDGRKQTVEYEADQAGYRPKISYEDTGAGLNGYGRSQGYENQGGPY